MFHITHIISNNESLGLLISLFAINCNHCLKCLAKVVNGVP